MFVKILSVLIVNNSQAYGENAYICMEVSICKRFFFTKSEGFWKQMYTQCVFETKNV